MELRIHEYGTNIRQRPLEFYQRDPIMPMLGKRTTRTYKKKQAPKKRVKREQLAGPGYNPKAQPRFRYRRPPGAEKKIVVEGTQPTNLTTDGTATHPTYAIVQSFNQIAQGDSQSTRDGNKILVDSLFVRYTCVAQQRDFAAPPTASSNRYFRVIIFLDTQCNGAIAPIDNLLDLGASNQMPFFAYNNVNSTGRYKILHDKMVELPVPTAYYSTGGTPYHISEVEKNGEVYLKGLNLEIRYGGASSNMADVFNNNIGMLILASGATAAEYAFGFRSRLRFYDY